MDHYWKSVRRWMEGDTWRWALGLIYILAVATIWIAASYIVQSVVDSGVSPFLITYICNSLFVLYIPIVEIGRYFEDSSGNSTSWFKQQSADSENVNLLEDGDHKIHPPVISPVEVENLSGTVLRMQDSDSTLHSQNGSLCEQEPTLVINDCSNQVDSKGRWTRTRVAKVSLLICPFWFFAQLSFNISLKYTTVTSNTILSSTSSLFTFLVALAFLGETFTWLKLISVLLCMGGTIIVSLADSNTAVSAIATNPLLGDILSLLSAGLYAVYITLIRKKLPDEEKGEGQASTAQFLGFIGLFNLFIFLPVALLLNFTRLEPFHKLSWNQFGLIVGKGLMDNVLSDYLWVKATQLTTTTVATAGLSIQVPIAAVVDTLTGQAPKLPDYIGAVAVMLGFAGINIPSDDSPRTQITQLDSIDEDHGHLELAANGSTNDV
ncbi:thiamine-repressible mitochondrial transport protein THI74-like [Canna indica]|uniref:Thiamine-repressible mitochondrial transport protein THI74-like n=1 Tax=Canna indica TaxID=4628 RepID=A0AAQ3QL30_9LILI|nr:thiamine-repressible mitochondrial transport protein THI74-like [Canna indica]